jgi:polyprenyl P-hydroxybenzoate/phenylacrylic acid decarboxylase-like protein
VAKKRLIIALTGASGVSLGISLLRAMGGFPDWERHLVISGGAEKVMCLETDHTADEVRRLATRSYSNGDIGASIASGTFRTEGMAVVPCSMKTLAGLASGYADNLILRAGDVTIKERRRLVLVPRETPLSSIHLRNMCTLAEMGVTILPPVLSFYGRPGTIDDMALHIVGKVMGVFGLEPEGFRRWEGSPAP